MLACRAAEAGAPIDGLVLWASPARGRDLTRQLKAFARLEASQVFEGLPDPPAPPEGELEVGGFVLTAETQAELGGVDLSALALPHGLPRGALLLERDGIAADERLRNALEGQGVTVAVRPGDGYGEMTSHPQQSQVPESVVSEVLAWLAGGEQRAGTPAAQAPQRSPSILSRWRSRSRCGPATAEIVETPLTIPQDFGDLSGILTTPRDGGSPLCLVMLNAGAIRRIGPNRMWVEAARRWAERGVSSLRLDVEAIGEADGAVSPYADDNALYVDALIPQVQAAIAVLAAARRGGPVRGRGALRRGLLGHVRRAGRPADHARRSCSTAAGSSGTPGWRPSRDVRRAFSQKLTWARIRHNVTGPRLKAVARWLLGMPARWLARRRGGRGRRLGQRSRQRGHAPAAGLAAALRVRVHARASRSRRN